ncbi:GumC family protein [Methylocystis parvus]|uniref:Polysaccharide biosynthesis tyrosine autokinase n=1 Tax=Methylocystis parvus TaxID=134 RepID=A0A6B8M9L5_9HYPH|nr:exopolysaccharide transport family protein [Methylocystis parvus]QGM99095.1 polysaccharide biosynthesis tyrosine autokinase [Methylocystis parvus]WBK00536.1 exopolysaccharide transport family protein [Methylocystis parvus OBBP]
MKKQGYNAYTSYMETRRSNEFGAIDLWRDAPVNFSLGGIELFFRRNWLPILATWLGVSAVLFGASLFLFKKYTATAVVLVDPRTAKVTRAGGVISNIGSDAIAIESLVQATRTDGFLGAMVDDLALTKDPYFAGKGDTDEKLRLSTIEKLASKLNIARRGTTYVIDVTATTSSPEESARIANAAAKKILAEQTSLRSGTSAKTAQEIESRLAELRGRVNRAEEAAAELKARLKVTAAGEGTTLLERRVQELNAQFVTASAHTAETRARYEQLRKAGASAGDSLPPSAQSPVFSALRSDYARLSRQSADQATVLGPRHPEVVSLNAQIADIRRQIKAEMARMMSTARTEFLEAQQREEELGRELRATQTESGELGPQLVKLTELEREAKAERDVYEELLNRQRELSQVKDLEPSDIRIVSVATPPSKPSPPRSILAVGSAALGLLAGLGYAIVREWRQKTLRTASQAERLGDVELYGFLPIVTQAESADDPGLVPDLTPWLTELCAEIAPAGASDEGIVILVSSTHRGEGRSTLSVNLAAYLAEGGDRVLLVEADRAAHVKTAPFGLLDVLESGEDLTSALIEQAADGYTLLPYGGQTLTRHSSIGGLMSGMTLRATLKLARKWFDVIVIDGPPALHAPQARFLAAQADHTVFLVEWDKTSADDANAALDRLDLNDAAILYNKADAAKLRLYDPEQSEQMTALSIAA